MLGKKLKDARISAGLTQLEVSQKTNIPRPIYANIEQDKILPVFQDFEKICTILKITNCKKVYSHCIHLKTACIHSVKSKSSINTYKLSVRLPRGEFSALTKTNLKKCGFANLQDFIKVAYEELQNRLKINELSN